MNLPGENIRVLVEGKTRGIIEETLGDDPCMSAVIRVCEDKVPRSRKPKHCCAPARTCFSEFARSSHACEPGDGGRGTR
jgi:hypothetical protein